MKNILIEYRLVGEKDLMRIVLSPSDYFGDGEAEFSIQDSVEKYFLEPRNYLNHPHQSISMLLFTLVNNDGEEVKTKYTYWDEGLNQIKDHSEFKSGRLIYRTIILSICIDKLNRKNLVLRLEEHNGVMLPITHTILDEKGILSKIDVSDFKFEA